VHSYACLSFVRSDDVPYSKAVDGHIASLVGYQLLMVSDMFYLSMNI
jgi:hypothetical protein